MTVSVAISVSAVTFRVHGLRPRGIIPSLGIVFVACLAIAVVAISLLDNRESRHRPMEWVLKALGVGLMPGMPITLLAWAC